MKCVCFGIWWRIYYIFVVMNAVDFFVFKSNLKQICGSILKYILAICDIMQPCETVTCNINGKEDLLFIKSCSI